jgi:protein-tyrosine phosphatase
MGYKTAQERGDRPGAQELGSARQAPYDDRVGWPDPVFKGIRNFRGLGGYRTTDGRRIADGRIFRSGHLHRLGGEEARRFVELRIASVADFRSPPEAGSEPDRLPPGLHHHALPLDIGAEEVGRALRDHERGDRDFDPRRFMRAAYREQVRGHSATYGTWLRGLADGSVTIPHVFHCAAGKDRTGLAAALLLMVLDVEPGTIYEDYLLTNERNGDFVEEMLAGLQDGGEALRPLFHVEESYLDAAFEEIGNLGGFSRYAEEALGLSPALIEALKGRLLE